MSFATTVTGVQDLQYFIPELWAPRIQLTILKENVALALCNRELESEFASYGDRIHKPYYSVLKAQTYTRNTEISTWNAIKTTDEYLDIDTAKIVPIYIDYLDNEQMKYGIREQVTMDAGRNLSNIIDQSVLAEYSNAYSYVSAQDLGGVGTGSVEINLANVYQMFAVASRKLDSYNRGVNDRFAVIGPRLLEILRLASSGRETAWGDMVGENGYIGRRYGFEIYMSNNVPFTAVLTNDNTQDTAGGTLTIGGVVFTVVADGAAAAAGEISRQDSADNEYASVVQAINGTGTAGADNYIDVSADDREFLYYANISASYTTSGGGGTDNILTITGNGDIAITETLDHTVVTSITQYPLFGVKRAIDFVVQKSPTVIFRECEDLLGTKIYAWDMYGKKTFTKNKKSLVYVKVNGLNWV